MSSGDSFKDRERALEDSFFFKRNQELLDQLKNELDTEDKKQALCTACGIQDDDVLESLVSAGVSCETVAAVSLVPLVLVAWADGKMDANERKAILKAAHDEGIDSGSVCHQLLERWLDEQPARSLQDGWTGYVGAISGKMSSDTLATFRSRVIGRARKVAKAAGGLLGVASISADEQAMLDELDAAFPS